MFTRVFYGLLLCDYSKGIINRLDSIRRNFLWQKNKERKGYHLESSGNQHTEQENWGARDQELQITKQGSDYI